MSDLHITARNSALFSAGTAIYRPDLVVSETSLAETNTTFSVVEGLEDAVFYFVIPTMMVASSAALNPVPVFPDTMLASEAVLRREWDTPAEDEAWANL